MKGQSQSALATPSRRLDPLTALGVVGNIVSVVGVVLTNKYVISGGFNFTMFLGFTHFLVTWLGCFLLLQLRVFTYRPVPFWKVLPVAVGSLGSVAFMNLTLAYNSVGFYQLCKLACIPFTVLVQRLVYRIDPPWQVKLTLLPILAGVGLATVHDVSVTTRGTVMAALAITFTAFAQIFTQSYQASLGCDALQLLLLTSPLIATGMLLLTPFFDDVPALLHVQWSLPLMGWILLSCLLALGVNMSNYLVLGKTSPLTYQVLGHLKTILVLLLGYAAFRYKVEARQLMGVVVAMAGVIAYTEVKRRGVGVGVAHAPSKATAAGEAVPATKAYSSPQRPSKSPLSPFERWGAPTKVKGF